MTQVAGMYAIMVQTDYIKKDKFRDNFWAAFKQVLGKGHAIKSLDKCDFTPIYEHLMAERDAKKALSKEVSSQTVVIEASSVAYRI